MLREDHYNDSNTNAEKTNTTTNRTNENLTVIPSSSFPYQSSSSSSISTIATKKTVSLPQLYKSLSSLSKFYKKHCVWPHCWASIVRQYHPLLKCNKRSHATCNIRQRRHLLGFHNSLKAVRRLNKHKHRHLHLKRAIKEHHGIVTENTSILPIPEIDVTTDNNLTTTRIQHAWTPPINYDTLKELSVNRVFKSLQLRHDLIFDPNLCFRPNLDGPSGRDKEKKAERYWKRVDRAFKHASSLQLQHFNETTFDFIKVILQELVRILVSLMTPFESSPASGTSFQWSWPTRVTKNQIYDTLDADLIIQQLKFKSPIDNQVNWLSTIFDVLCPMVHQQRLVNMKRYFAEQRYAKALKQCFQILEIIKLDCANRVLRHYRSFLIETCTEFEYRCLKKQYERKEMKMDSVYKWIKQSYHRCHGNINSHHGDTFQQIYYQGLVHLVTDDYETVNALQLQPILQFPVTLQFDERRLTHQFRYEFQNMIVIAILMVPYRHLSGKYVNTEDILLLKKLYTSLLKDASVVVTNDQVCGSKKNDNQVSCYQLALHSCYTAMKRHERNNSSMTSSKLIETTKFWEEWLSHNLKPTSLIFKLMYDRICGQLAFYARYGELSIDTTTEVIGLESDLESLGSKLKLVADLNLETYGVIYKSVAKCIQDNNN